MGLKKKRKTHSGASVSDSIPLSYDSPSGRSSSTSTASSEAEAAAAVTERSSAGSGVSGRGSASSSSSDSPSDCDEGEGEEELDVMGTPAALAPSTVMPAQLRLAFTPSARREAEGAAGGSDDSTFRRLNFTTKECATPGRYDARHKLGQPLAVYCRIKPMLAGELEGEEAESAEKVMQVESETSLICTAPKDSALYRHGELVSKFTFSRILGPDSTQEEVYLHTTKPMVDAFYTGQNGLIFAYGITASGKTYSMQGTHDAPGIIPRIVLDVFQHVMNGAPSEATGADEGEGSGTGVGGQRFTVKASYLEIYNESINDLLVEPSTKLPTTGRGAKTRGKAAAGPAVCRLQQNGTGGNDETSVVNLREVEIRNHREALALLEQGQANRTIHETTLNADSSRSHSVFTLKLVLPNGAVWSRLSVVDLAGSERTKRVSHAANSAKDTRMRETVNINQSLLVLGRCLEALRYNQNAPRKAKVVPFRESAITRLFKDSLSGWGRTVMLTAASQNPADYDETVHALKYAAVAKEVRVVMHKVDSKRTRAARASTTTALAPGRPSAGVKRQASQAMLDLDDMDPSVAASSNGAAAAPAGSSSSWDADDGANPPYDDLLHECFLLKQRVVELELASARVEEQVREELTSQQEQLLDEMEQTWTDRLERERAKAEEKNKKLFRIWQMEYKAQMQAQMQAQAQADAKENVVLADNYNTSKVLRGLRSK